MELSTTGLPKEEQMVVVLDVPDTLELDKLLVYFGNSQLSGGGDVNQEECYMEGRNAVITFEELNSALEVLKRRHHTINHDRTLLVLTVERKMPEKTKDKDADPMARESECIPENKPTEQTSSRNLTTQSSIPQSNETHFQVTAGEMREFMEWKQNKNSQQSNQQDTQAHAEPRHQCVEEDQEIKDSSFPIQSPPQYTKECKDDDIPQVGIKEQITRERNLKEKSRHPGMYGNDEPPAYSSEDGSEDGSDEATIELASHSIKVSDLPIALLDSPDTLHMYFESNNRSGGGSLDYSACNIDKDEKSAILTFKNPDAVTRVMNKTQTLNGIRLNIEVGPSAAPKIIDKRRFLLCNINADTNLEVLKMYLANITNLENPTIEYYENNENRCLVVTYPQNLEDIISVIDKIKQKKYKGQQLDPEIIYKANCIVINNFAEVVSAVNGSIDDAEEALRLYIEKEENAGENGILKVKTKLDEGTSVIHLTDNRVVEKILERPQELFGVKLHISQYLPEIDFTIHSSMMTTPVKLPPPIIKKVTEQVFFALMSENEFKQQFQDVLIRKNACIKEISGKDCTITIAPTLSQSSPISTITTWRGKITMAIEEVMKSFVFEAVKFNPQYFGDLKDSLDGKPFCFFPQNDDSFLTIVSKKQEINEKRTEIQQYISQLQETKQNTSHSEKLNPCLLQYVWRYLMPTLEDQYSGLHFLPHTDGDEGIAYDGPNDLVQKFTAYLREITLRLKTRNVHGLSEKVQKQLKEKRMMEEIQKYMEGLGEKVAIYALQSGIMLAAENDDTITKAQEVISFNIEEITHPIQKEIQHINKTSFESFEMHIDNHYKGLVKIYLESEPLAMTIVALKKISKEVVKKVDEFLEENKEIRLELRIEDGKACFIQQYVKIEDIEARNDVKVTIDESLIIFLGTTTSAKEAYNELLATANIIEVDDFEMNQKGISNFFSTKNGKQHIQQISKEESCVILYPSKTDSSVEQAQEVTEQSVPRGIFRFSSNKHIELVQGDICSQTADVIVCPTDTYLNTEGKIATVVMQMGGEQFDTQVALSRDKSIIWPEGNIECIPASGLLRCRLVIFTIGPKWRNGGNEVAILQSTVAKVLSCVADHKFSSVAIPILGDQFPKDKSIKALVNATSMFLEQKDTSVKHVLFIDPQNIILDRFEVFLQDRKPQQNFEAEEMSSIDSVDNGDGYMAPLPRRPENLQTSLDGYYTSVNTKIKMPSFPPPLPPRNEIDLMTSEKKIIKLRVGAIERQRADVLVNSLNVGCDLNNGAISKAFAKAGGKKLQKLVDEKVQSIGGVEEGSVFITGPADLACKEVYHVICSRYERSKENNTKVLRDLIRQILLEAHKYSRKSISFPIIGAGGLEYPPEIVAKEMYDEVISFSKKKPKSSVNEVIFVVYEGDKKSHKAFQNYAAICTSAKTTTATGTSEAPQQPPKGYVFSPPLEKIPSILYESNVANKITLQLKKGDITKETSSVIVNGISEALSLQMGGVSTAIDKAAGPSVQAELDDINTGLYLQRPPSIVVTKAGKLSAKKIFHLVIDLCQDNFSETIKQCLQKTEQLKLCSIAFPLLGAGKDGELTAVENVKHLLEAVIEYATTMKIRFLKNVILTVFQDEMFDTIHGIFLSVSTDKMSTFDDQAYYEAQASFPPSATLALPEGAIRFRIYANSKDVIRTVKERIRDFVRNEWHNEDIHMPSIRNLSRKNEEKIMQIGRDHEVAVTVERDVHISRITVVGRQFETLKASQRIKELLQTIEEEKTRYNTISKSIQWYYQDTDEDFKPFPVATNGKIEQNSASQNKFSIKEGLIQWNFTYSSLIEGYVTRASDNIKMKMVKREANEDLPIEWENQSIGVSLVKLDSKSREYNNREGIFMATIESGCSSIVEISRVENPTLYKQYVLNKKKVCHNSRKKIEDNERFLFHGTKKESCQLISESGFNRSYSGLNFGAVHGKGAYFAVKSEYSSRDVFSPPDENGIKYMYIAKVLTGEYCKGEENMVDTPKRSVPTGHVGPVPKFDSAVDKVEDPEIFVTFSDNAAYPAYLVKFKA